MEFWKKLLVVLLVAAGAYGAYLAYVKWFDAGVELAKKKAEAVKTEVAGKAEAAKEGALEKAKGFVSDIAGEAADAVGGYVKEKVAAGLAGAGKGAIDAAGTLAPSSTAAAVVPSTVQTISNGAGAVLPAPSGGNYDAPAPPVTVSVKKESPLVFSVNRGTSYAVDWGDKSPLEKGVLAKGTVKLLSHDWDAPGDYEVKITVNTGKTETETTMVRVYE